MALISSEQAVEALKREDVVGIPTETVYGLAGRIDSEVALKKIFSVKARPFFDPLIVHVESLAQAKLQASAWPEVFDVLAGAFWPGPLTLVTGKAPHISSLITSGLSTVALRCPRHPVALQLIREVGVPLAAPSANRFGHTSPTSSSHVEEEFQGHVNTVEGGPCEIGLESTVVQVEQKDSQWDVTILRPGGISRDQIHEALKIAGIKFQISRQESSASPGHLKHHYQPNCPVVLLQDQEWDAKIQLQIEKHFHKSFTFIHRIRFTSGPLESARTLYEEFRNAAKNPDALIVVEKPQEQSDPQWEAIWDRVERAASFIL